MVNFKVSPVRCGTVSSQFVFEQSNFISVSTCWHSPSPAASTKGKQDDGDNSEALSFTPLNYPAPARAARVQGVVVLRVGLDSKGKVKSVEPLTGSQLLVSEAATNVRNWQFRPNLQNMAIAVYDFRMIEGACRPETGFFTFTASNLATIFGCGVEVTD